MPRGGAVPRAAKTSPRPHRREASRGGSVRAGGADELSGPPSRAPAPEPVRSGAPVAPAAAAEPTPTAPAALRTDFSAPRSLSPEPVLSERRLRLPPVVPAL